MYTEEEVESFFNMVVKQHNEEIKALENQFEVLKNYYEAKIQEIFYENGHDAVPSAFYFPRVH